MARLDGRVTIVTGAGRGIGRSVARLLAADGASVVVNDLGAAVDGSGQDSGPAHDVVAEIGEVGGKAIASGADISDFTAAENLIKTAIEEFGRLNIVVNVAGILRDRMVFNMTEQEWDNVIRVHLKGTFNTTKFASAHWRSLRDESAQNRIINFTSVSGLHGAAPRPRSARRCGASPPRWRPVRWIGLDVVLIATHEQFRATAYPWVIRGHVVGHVVQDQPRAALSQGGTRHGKPGRAAEGRVGHVAAHAVRRSGDIGALQVRQRIQERRLQPGIGVRQGQPGRASLPHAHQPERRRCRAG